MFNIENICKRISNSLAKELNLNDAKKEVINYGIFAFIQMAISILLVIILGFILNVTIEAFIISFVVSILRKSSGGIHASSPGMCTIIGTISSVGLGLISKNINTSLNITILSGSIILLWSYYTIYKLAPVDSIAKPIKNIKKRNRLKKSSIVILSIYLIIILINILCYVFIKDSIFLIYSTCIYMGILFQVFSLTKGGHLILGILNKF